MNLPLDEIKSALNQEGYYHGHLPTGTDDPVDIVLEVSRSQGELFVPQDCDPNAPVIRTAPTLEQGAAPFDRPEAIGWHGDFATHDPDRPELSVVYVTRPDPRSTKFGAWRLASVAQVIAKLQSTQAGRLAFGLFCEEPLPFSYADGEPTQRHLVFHPMQNGSLGLRFYLPSIRRGCMTEYGEVPATIASALAALEKAADDVAEIVPTRSGSLLVVSNWFALHDRLQQTVSRTRANRESLLCFVARQRVGALGKDRPDSQPSLQ